MRHINIPIFIPHLGCPNQCVFCNQRSISGVKEFNPDEIDKIIIESLSTAEQEDEVEIAFFGGSFTGIDREMMVALLDKAYVYVKAGRVSAIRCSTRPDYISEEILAILRERGVKVIELGLQSSSDEVLKLTKRGHDSECELRACKMIVESGFTLVGQMMIGLPGSDEESEIKTAELIISSGAKGARIYPTVVFKDTELCCMAESRDYIPLTVDEAVRRSAKVFSMFLDNNVEVIRIGLCSSENLVSDNTYHSGPNHPALGELVLNEYYFSKISDEIRKCNLSGTDKIKIKVAPGRLSSAIGQRKRNKLLLSESFPHTAFSFAEDGGLYGFDISVEKTIGDTKCT